MELIDIQPQKYVDEFCAEYRRLDEHLKHPKHKLPMSFESYSYSSNGNEKIKISKYFRNIGTLEKLESFINHLDSFFTSVEYFQRKVDLIRTEGEALSNQYKEEMFFKIASDSIRSSLDIYSKVVAWYFDFPNKKEIGFSYKSFIENVKNYSVILMNKLNELYNSKEYKIINDFRNADKHIGFDRFEMNVTRSKNKYELNIKRVPPLNTKELEEALLYLLEELKSIIKISVDVFSNFELGYDSKNDFEVIVQKDGTLALSSIQQVL